MSDSQILKTDSVTEQVLSALENPAYVWRTVTGLEKETQLPTEQILHTLNEFPDDKLVVSRSADGKTLYSTRDHYRKTQSFAGRLLSVLSDKAK